MSHTYSSQYLILPKIYSILPIESNLLISSLVVNSEELEIAEGIYAVYQPTTDDRPIFFSKYVGLTPDGTERVYSRVHIRSPYVVVRHSSAHSHLSLEGLQSIVSLDGQPTLQERDQLLEPLKDNSVFGWSLEHDSADEGVVSSKISVTLDDKVWYYIFIGCMVTAVLALYVG